jgi:hypothetical protein
MEKAEMAKARKKTYRTLNFTPSPEKKQIATKQLVLTLGVPDGDVIKVEKLEKSGQRREVSEEEFAALAGEEATELGEALEEAYSAGITDAINNELSEAEEDEEEEEEILRRFILRRAAGRQLLRRGVRRFILRRLIRREAMQRRARPEGKAGPSETRAA